MKQLFWLLLVPILLLACRGGDEPSPAPQPPAATATPSPTPAPLINEPLDSPLRWVQITRLQRGNGDLPVAAGMEVRLQLDIHDDGRETWSGSFEFVLGTGQGSPALEAAVLGAVAGEQRRALNTDVERVYHFTVQHVGSQSNE